MSLLRTTGGRAGGRIAGTGLNSLKQVNVVIDNTSHRTDNYYTYLCDHDSVKVGSVVQVPFGRRKDTVTGYVFEVMEDDRSTKGRLKKVASVSEELSIPEDLIHLCVWMKQRYLCRYIDGVRCIIPPGSAPSGRVRDPYEASGDEGEQRDLPPPLTEEQDDVLQAMMPSLRSRDSRCFLINGVTSSGKTEVYLRAAQEVLEQGRDVIVLVPEISLTPQMIQRFQRRFGWKRVAVMHSRMTKKQRYLHWMKARTGQASVMIGARSAIFAPFADPGLIIIDEEHESSYKSDQTPKYHAISTALERAGYCGATVILGSATPSVISSYRAASGEYTELRMRKRHNLTPLPEVVTVDMREELKNGNRTIFSKVLYQHVRECLDQGKQAILFLNRRGYSSFISCRSCGFVLKCDACGVSMTYHKSSGSAVCHYCGRKLPVPKQCPECGSPYIRHFGTGTEQVQEAAERMFEGASVARLDLDTVQRKGESERILRDFRSGRTDILVGTQLVAKGLDFDQVGVVGIVAADLSLNVPDYRSAERTYQLIVQAAGRAGRGDERGLVVIQTYTPDHVTIQTAAEGDYDRFYQNELTLRRITGYPPFTDILRLVFTGPDEKAVLDAAIRVCTRITASGVPAEGEVFPPQPAYMARFNEMFRYHVVIKCSPERTGLYLSLMEGIQTEFSEKNASIRMVPERNPYSFT